jgi:hypothetical protein
MKSIRYINAGYPDTGAWKGRHSRAVEVGLRNYGAATGAFHPGAIVQAINAWCNYAEAHKRRFESDIGCDYVLGPAWMAWGLALRRLLDGETGQLDCGTLDTIIHDNLNEQGYKEGVDW